MLKRSTLGVATTVLIDTATPSCIHFEGVPQRTTTRMPNTKKSVVVWVRQELFQQRVCPAVDIDLIATYRVVDQLWKQSRNDVFSRDVLVQVCQDVLNLRKRKAALLFQGYKIMEAWAGFDKALQQRAESVAKPGESASHLGLVSLMAQFLFVRNYSIPPTATATDLKLQVESVYPSSGQSTSASNPRRAALNLKSHSWSSTMKLRQSSADQHCKYVLKNFKSLLRLVVRDLAEHPSFDEAVITEEEIDNFNFLFGCCVQEVRTVCLYARVIDFLPFCHLHLLHCRSPSHHKYVLAQQTPQIIVSIPRKNRHCYLCSSRARDRCP